MSYALACSQAVLYVFTKNYSSQYQFVSQWFLSCVLVAIFGARKLGTKKTGRGKGEKNRLPGNYGYSSSNLKLPSSSGREL